MRDKVKVMTAAHRRHRFGRAGAYLVDALAMAAAVVVAAALLLTWRLSQGPIDVAALVPFLEQQFSARHQGFAVRVGSAAIEWGGWRRVIALRLSDVRAVDRADGVIGGVPALSMTLRPRALIRGEFVPVEITLHEPSLRLVRGADGLNLRFDTRAAGRGIVGPDLLPQALTLLMAEPSDERPLSRLQRLDVRGARLVVEDARLGVQWVVPSSDIKLAGTASGLEGELAADLITARDRADVVAFGSYDRLSRRANVAIAFGALRPAAFAAVTGRVPGLEGLDLPLSGTVTLDLDAGGTLHRLGVDLSGGAGQFDPRLLTLAGLDPAIVPDAPISIAGFALRGHFAPAEGRWRVDALRFDLPLDDGLAVPGLPEPVRVSSVEGRGHLDTVAGELVWEDVLIDLGSDGTLRLPDPVGHTVPVKRIRSAGRWAIAAGRIDIERIDAALAGPRASLAGTVRLAADGAQLTAAVRIDDLATEQLMRYWPPSAAPGALEWVRSHLSGGGITTAEVLLEARLDGGEVTVGSLAGQFAVADVDVDYLPPMPQLRSLSATATFDQKSIIFDVSPAAGPGVAIGAAEVALLDLPSETPRLEVEVVTSGGVADHLRLIDHPPLFYADAVGIDPADTAGRARVRLKITVPLLADVRLTDVEVGARARLDAVSIADLVPGRHMQRGTLDVQVDTESVRFRGEAWLGDVGGRLEGWQVFDPGDGIAREIIVTVTDADLANVHQLLFAAGPLPAARVDGAIDAELRIQTLTSGEGRIEARLDLLDALIDLPSFAWRKRRGAPAAGRVLAELDRERLSGVPQFTLAADDLDVAGSALIDPDGGLDRVEFERLRIGRTDVGGVLIPIGDDTWTLVARGRSLDLGPFLNPSDTGPVSGVEQVASPDGIAVTLDVASLWLGAEKALRDVSGALVREDGHWSSVDLTGVVDGGGTVVFRIAPDAEGRRRLFASADDAGAMLSALGLYDDMRGGRLTITGVYQDQRPSRPLSGRLLITDYHVRNAPTLAQVLGLMALTEIDNTLRGEGLSFDILDAPFTLDGRYLSLSDARAAGLSLGVTASGTIDVEDRELDVRGTVVPIYALNSALGNLPVIGFLFSGGERGGGLFAPTYSVSGAFEDPQVIVNPVAALTPGVLRGVFDVFDGGRSMPDVGIAGGEPN